MVYGYSIVTSPLHYLSVHVRYYSNDSFNLETLYLRTQFIASYLTYCINLAIYYRSIRLSNHLSKCLLSNHRFSICLAHPRLAAPASLCSCVPPLLPLPEALGVSRNTARGALLPSNSTRSTPRPCYQTKKRIA